MATRMFIGGLLATLLCAAAWSNASGRLYLAAAVALAQEEPSAAPEEDGRIYKWEKDLRWFAFRLLKDIRRLSIRLVRLLRRSVDYWLGWLLRGTVLLLFAGLVSAVDRRLLLLGWKRGVRVALSYATVGVIVFLRLLRDRRIAARDRVIVPLAIIYAIGARYWLTLGSQLADLIVELAVVALAARVFVHRCPDALVEQHAVHARRRVLARLTVSSSGQTP
jgi:hypothetical protein